jgi:hypothetical protein
MNMALDKYVADPRVISITGWCPPIAIPADYQYDGFFLRRCNGWGFGIWKDRYDSIPIDTAPSFSKISSSWRLRKAFSSYGMDMLAMLEKDAARQMYAGDVKIMSEQFHSDRYTLYPTRSLVRNIGHDGSGVNCTATDRFDSELCYEHDHFQLPNGVVLDPRIIKNNYMFRKIPPIPRIRSAVKRFLKK